MTQARYAKQKLKEFILSAGDFSSGVNTGWIDVQGFSQITLELSTAYSAASDVRMYIDVANDIEGTSTAYRVQGLQGGAVGVYTDADLNYTHTLGAADNWCWNIPINYKYMRFYFDCPSADAVSGSDTLTVHGRLGVNQ